VLTENNVTKAEKLYPADPEKTAKAKELVKNVKDRLMPTVCAPLLGMLCYITRDVYAKCFKTFQVQLAADRIPVLGISPDFVCSLESDNDIMFGLFHESMHLIRHHLLTRDLTKFSDPRWVEANEAWINAYVTKLTDLPLISFKEAVTAENPEGVTIVNPKTVYNWCKKAAKDQKVPDFPEYDDFYATEQVVYDWLCQLGRDSKTKKNDFCSHAGDGEPSDADMDPDSMSPVLDDDAVGEFVQRGIESVLRKAVNDNNENAQKELKALIKSIGGDPRAEKLFGDLGAYQLLGITTPEKKTSLWDNLMRRHVGRLLIPGTKLRINKKRFDTRMLVRRGSQKIQEAVIAVDSSGSMYGEVLDKLKVLVGKTNAHVTWLWWDGDVYPFKPGDEVRGGGGTDCRLVDQWIIANMRTYPDIVICVTDGQFTHFTPRMPNKWVWLLTKDGDHWPRTWTPPMNSVILPF
jgi:hypothetical protein